MALPVASQAELHCPTRLCCHSVALQEPSRLVLVADYVVSTAASLAWAAALYHVGWAWAGALPAAARAAAAVVLLWLPARQWWGARPTAGALCGEWHGARTVHVSHVPMWLPCLCLPLHSSACCSAAALFYEELELGHAAPGWRCAAASLLELAYVGGSAGQAAPAAASLMPGGLDSWATCLFDCKLPVARSARAGAGALVSLAMRCSSRRQCVGELLAGVQAVQEVQLTAPLKES